MADLQKISSLIVQVEYDPTPQQRISSLIAQVEWDIIDETSIRVELLGAQVEVERTDNADLVVELVSAQVEFSPIEYLNDAASDIPIEGPAPTIYYDRWDTSWTVAGAWDATSSGHHQFRQIIDASKLSLSGGMLKIKLGTYGSNTYNVDHCTIGERSGSTEDFASTPTRITFDGGNNGCSVPVGGKWSDEIAFAIDETKTYLIHLDMGTGLHPNWYTSVDANKCYYSSGSGEEFTLDVTMTLQTYSRVIAEIQVWTGSTYDAYTDTVTDIVLSAPAPTLELVTPGGGLFYAQG